MRRFILFFILVLISWASFAQLHIGILASSSAGGTPAISYSLANAGHANLKHDIDKTATGTDGEPEVLEVANGDFWIGKSGTTFNYSFTEGDVSTITKESGDWDTNQSRNLMHWSPDGLALYTGNFAENVYGYGNGSTPYSEGGRSYLGTLFNLSAYDTDIRGYAYNGDGTKIWAMGVVSSTIYEFDLVPAYTGATSVTNVASYDASAIVNAPAGMDLSPDENYMIWGNRGDDSITSLKLTTTGTLSGGATLDRSLSVDWWQTTVYGVKYSEDGRYIYNLDTSLDDIQQIDINNLNTYGAELLGTPDFSSDTNWTKGSGWSISGGNAVHDGSATSTLSQSVSLIAGETYVVQIECTANSTGNTNPVEAIGQSLWSGARMYDQSMPSELVTISFTATSTQSSSIQLYGRSGISGYTIANFSIKQVTNKP